MTDAIRFRTGITLGSWAMGMPPDGGFYVDLARQVEALGYDLLFSGDHLFMSNPNADTLSVLSAWTGVTQRVVLGTAVLLLPLREPAVVAKQLATIDYLSGGRLAVGLGVGGEVKEEWHAMEVPLSSRGRRMDESIELLRALWSGDLVDHRGEFRSVTGVSGSPLPGQDGGPPLWIGGRSAAALRRASRNEGWCAFAVSPDRIVDSLSLIRQHNPNLAPTFRTSCVLFTHVDDDRERAEDRAATVLGRRSQRNVQRFLDQYCAVGDAEVIRSRVAAYRDAGVDDVLLYPQATAEEYPDQVERLADVLGIS